MDGKGKEGVATLLPVGFPNLARRDADLGQGSFCHFRQFYFCADLDHLCLAVSWWSLCQVPLWDGRSEAVG